MFSTPVVLTEDSHPIGRGIVQLLKGEKGSGLGSMCGAYFMFGLSSADDHNRHITDILVAWQVILCDHRRCRKIGRQEAVGEVVGSQSDQAVELLQNMIELGELEPGSMVSERALVEVTGLGRTPVREALQRLALTRMLRIHASKGIEISGVSVEDQLNGLEVRRAMERLTVLLACQRATPKDIGDMVELRARLAGNFSLRSYAATVRETHSLIIRATRNPYLQAALVPLQSLSRRFWLLHVRDDAQEIIAGKALHEEILSGIVQRDVDTACAASLALNDYLVRFALETLSDRARPAS